MQQVRLTADGPWLSRLGFGCAALMARIDRPGSGHLLRVAFEAGITHFDTARSYGYGEAELALGDLIAAVGRDRVTVTTKLGILPPRRTPLLGAAKSAARLVAAAHPGLRRLLRRGAAGLVRTGAFDVAAATASLEASLRALRTDHVDLLLLHDCRPDDLTEGLLGFLEAARRDGKIRGHGIATSPAASAAIRWRWPEFAPVVQLADGLFRDGQAGLPAATPLITHSALGPSFAALLADAGQAAEWSAAAGFDLRRERRRFAGLCLGAALAANPHGAVLFSSTDAANIRANAAIPGQLAALAGPIAQLRALGAGPA